MDDLIRCEIVRRNCHREHIGFQWIKRNPPIRPAARHDAVIVVTGAILAERIIFQIAPMEPTSDCKILRATLERRRDCGEIFAVIEFRVVHELPVFGILGHFRSGEPLKKARMAQRVDININDRGVICRQQLYEILRGDQSRRSEPIEATRDGAG